MGNLKIDSNIVIKNETYEVRDLAEKLSTLTSDEIKENLQAIGLTIPKHLRMEVLRETLADAVRQTRAERASLADELGYRLSWFYRYSEYQLENLLKYYDSKSLNRRYLELLWVELLDYMIEKKVDERDIARLIELTEGRTDITSEDILAFNLNLKDLFYDEEGQIDGLTPENFRPVLYKSSTLVELRELGKKYGVNVPRRLKKNQLADIIVDKLRERGELTEGKEEEIRKMPIVLMQRFAKDNDVKASIELTKEEIIEYILSNASQTKESYFLPSDRSIYEQELTEEEEAIPEAVEEEPEVEEEVVEEEAVVEEEPEVEEEPVVEEPEEEPEAPVEEPTEEEGPIVLNVANFDTDENYAREDAKRLKRAARRDAQNAPRAGQPQSQKPADQLFAALTWIIAIVLLVIVLLLLVTFFKGGLI